MSAENVNIDNAQLLDSLNLIDGSFLKRAGVLLFHHNPEKWIPGCYIKIGYFSSDTEVVYQDEIHGSLLSQAEKVIDLIYTKYLKGIISYEGVSRIETYPYPRDAVREAVLNAIAHKNYSTLIPIQIKVFDEKMSISNDCIFPDDWTMEDFLGCHRSRPYNPLIANTFYRAGFIESWGRGIQKIREACLKSGNKEPIYNIKKDEITITFEAKPSIEEEEPSIKARKEAFYQLVCNFRGSVNNLIRLFEALCDADSFGRKDIMEICGIQVSSSGDLLNKLKEVKAIEPVVGHGKGRYRFIV